MIGGMIMGKFNFRWIQLGLSSVLVSVTLLSFQNCGRFSTLDTGALAGNTTGSFGLASSVPLAAGPLTPEVSTITSGQTLQLTQANGSSSGAYQVVAGSGTVDPSTGLFTPAGNNTDAIVGRPDVDGHWSYSFVKVASAGMPMALSPAGSLLASGQSVKISAAGGSAPYIYSLNSGSHSIIDAVTGVVTAGSVDETAVVTCTDSNGKTATASVEVKMATDPAMAVLYAPNPMIVSRQVTFVVVGGTAPYTIALVSGNGSVNGKVFTPDDLPGSVAFTITDSHGQVVHINSQVIDDPTLPAVVAGAMTFDTPGTYTYVVPSFHSISVEVKGAGGGGGGRGSNNGYGATGSPGALSSFGDSVLANGGGGGVGGAWLGRCGYQGADGTATGGDTNVTGGGATYGLSGSYGNGDCGGSGGSGGKAVINYSRVVVTSTLNTSVNHLAPGTSITIVVGAGGMGGLDGWGTRTATPGADGSVVITVN